MTGVIEGGKDVGSVLRALRRQADLSQRQLAALAGVPKSTVARIEAGATEGPNFQTVARLVDAAGGRLTVSSTGGASSSGSGEGPPVEGETTEGRLDPVPHDGLRDEAGRRYPAHLDVREVRDLRDWSGAWWAPWYRLPPDRWPLRVPAATFDLHRAERDLRRLRSWIQRETMVRRATEALPDGAWRFVAELPDGRLIGELRAHQRSVDLLIGCELGDERELVLDGVLVTPEARRLGIGSRLVAALVGQLDRGDLGSVVAMAEIGGADFLIACGFRIECHRPLALSLTRNPGRGVSPSQGVGVIVGG